MRSGQRCGAFLRHERTKGLVAERADKLVEARGDVQVGRCRVVPDPADMICCGARVRLLLLLARKALEEGHRGCAALAPQAQIADVTLSAMLNFLSALLKIPLRPLRCSAAPAPRVGLRLLAAPSLTCVRRHPPCRLPGLVVARSSSSRESTGACPGFPRLPFLVSSLLCETI